MKIIFTFTLTVLAFVQIAHAQPKLGETIQAPSEKETDEINAEEAPWMIPAAPRAVLEHAESFELLSLDPNKWDPDKQDTFHGAKELGRIKIENADTRKMLVEAIHKGVAQTKGHPAAGAEFMPKHGIRVKRGDKTFDFLISGYCKTVNVFAGEKSAGQFMMSDSTDIVFDKVFKAHDKQRGADIADAIMITVDEFKQVYAQLGKDESTRFTELLGQRDGKVYILDSEMLPRTTVWTTRVVCVPLEKLDQEFRGVVEKKATALPPDAKQPTGGK